MRDFWQWWCRLSRGAQIAAVVFGAHGIILICLCVHHFLGGKAPAARSTIAVRTVQAIAPPVHASVASPSPRPSSSSQKKRAVAKKPSPLKTAPAKTEPKSSEQQKLLRTIAEDLNGLRAHRALPKQELTLPTSLPTSIFVENEEVTDLSYSDILIPFLQDNLDLPDYGAVKVRLEIDEEGKLRGLDIVETQSRKNEEFLKQRLSALTFPSPEGAKEPLSYTITFKNKG